MSSIILITGSIDDIDTHDLDLSQLYYKSYYKSYHENKDNPDAYIVKKERFPMRVFGNKHGFITQYLGSGKTLSGMQMLCEKHYFQEDTAANLGLAWDNEDKLSKDEWTSKINSMEDLYKIKNTTILLDDVRSTISHFACKESVVVSEIANAGRKNNNDFIITAQREIMIPKDLRDMASEWIVPIIRIRDFTQFSEDNTGRPVELLMLHFDGTKNFIGMSPPYRGLERLFNSYNTIQRAIGLKVPEKVKELKKR